METEWDSVWKMPDIVQVLHGCHSWISFSSGSRVWGFDFSLTFPHTMIRSLKSTGLQKVYWVLLENSTKEMWVPGKPIRSFMQKPVGVTAEDKIQQVTVSVAWGYAEDWEILGKLSKMMWRMADGVPRFDEAIATAVLTRKSVQNERPGVPLIYPTVTLCFYYFRSAEHSHLDLE